MYENDVQNLHRACDEIVDHYYRIAGKAEAISVEAQQLKNRAETLKYGNASNSDITRAIGAAEEMDSAYSELARALDVLQSIRFG